jgi:hypothetical protein
MLIVGVCTFAAVVLDSSRCDSLRGLHVLTAGNRRRRADGAASAGDGGDASGARD